MTDHRLLSTDPITALARAKGLERWSSLLRHVRALPYGRNASRRDFGLVLSEGRGSCSSEHAFLKRIADENDLADVKLILGIYRMTGANTPGVGGVLKRHGVKYIPEAHCYLEIGRHRKDVTSPTADITRLAADIIEEHYITPDQVVDYKVRYHRRYLRQWLTEQENAQTFEQLWRAREECIEALAGR